MGAWEFAQPLLHTLLGERLPLHYVGRPRRASPAEGSAAWHQVNQAAIVERALRAERQAVAAPRAGANAGDGGPSTRRSKMRSESAGKR
jgi:2-oxoglutarate dehydrogenase E1 component